MPSPEMRRGGRLARWRRSIAPGWQRYRRGRATLDDLVEICHGSPSDEDEYVFDEIDAVRALKTSARPVCLFGHTHHPVIFELSGDALDTIALTRVHETRVPLVEGSKYLINPGSIGQPRDGDPRARLRHR